MSLSERIPCLKKNLIIFLLILWKCRLEDLEICFNTSEHAPPPALSAFPLPTRRSVNPRPLSSRGTKSRSVAPPEWILRWLLPPPTPPQPPVQHAIVLWIRDIPHSLVLIGYSAVELAASPFLIGCCHTLSSCHLADDWLRLMSGLVEQQEVSVSVGWLPWY